jgi:hypothetical protein
VTLSQFHAQQHADSLVPILVSLYDWTPYYWDQDRFGMLVPLMSRPIGDPFVNLLTQTFVTVSCGIGALWAIAGYYLKAPALAAALGIAVFVTTAPLGFQFTYLGTAHPYNVSLLLAFVALSINPACARSGRTLLAVVQLLLLATATWVNAAILLLLIPLVSLSIAMQPIAEPASFGGRLVRCLQRVIFNPSVIALVSLLVLSTMLQRLAPVRTTWIVVPEPVRWFGLLAAFGASAISQIGIGPLVWVNGVATTIAVWVSVYGYDGQLLRRLAATSLALLAYGSLMAVLFFGRGRYFIPGVILFQAMVWVFLVGSLRFRTTISQRARPVVLVLICAVAVSGTIFRYGWPSSDSARTALMNGPGSYGRQVLDAGATHVIGDYWTVWPAVFQANVLLNERGIRNRTIWGITDRGRVTEWQWRAEDESRMLLAGKVGDPEIRKYLKEFGLDDFYEVGRSGDLSLFQRRRVDGDVDRGPSD